MAGSDFHHGIRVDEINEGTIPIRTVSTAVIGMLATADDADPDVFPENTPVLITNVNGVLGNAGDKGTLARSLEAISQQTKPYTIVVRVPEGETEEETTSNISERQIHWQQGSSRLPSPFRNETAHSGRSRSG